MNECPECGDFSNDSKCKKCGIATVYDEGNFDIDTPEPNDEVDDE